MKGEDRRWGKMYRGRKKGGQGEARGEGRRQKSSRSRELKEEGQVHGRCGFGSRSASQSPVLQVFAPVATDGTSTVYPTACGTLPGPGEAHITISFEK